MTSINMFMNMIYKKVPFSILHIFSYYAQERRVKKFRKKILEGSPSFGLLWKMADFVKAAEFVFLYDNSTKNERIGLFSSKGYAPGNNGFKINTPNCNIVVKLFSDANRVIIEIERKHGEAMKNFYIFENEQWMDEPSAYDEMLIDQIISIINSKIIELFDYCYRIK